MKIDITKPIKTRGGRPVTLISDQGRWVGNASKKHYPLVGYIGDSRELKYWQADGRYHASDDDSCNDLIQEQEVWVNFYDESGIFYGVHPDKETAIKAARAPNLPNPVARIRVPVTVGRFDE